MAGKSKKIGEHSACIFCRRTDAKITKEDVLPDWIAVAEIKGIKAEFFAQTGPSGDPYWPSGQYPAMGTFGWKVKGPCKPCNSGWMSGLETGIRHVLVPMMEGRALSLTKADLDLLSIWCFKTALMWEYMTARRSKRRPHYTQAERWKFYRSRTLPLHTFIYAVHSANFHPTFMIGGPVRFLKPKTRISVVTISIHDFAFQVVGLRLAHNRKAPVAARIHNNGWAQIERAIYPPPNYLDWPPIRALDHDGIGLWARRWLTPGTPSDN